MKRPTPSHFVIALLVIGALVLLWGMRSNGQQIGRLLGAIDLSEQTIERERLFSDSLNTQYASLKNLALLQEAELDSLRASRGWWFRQALDKDTKLNEIVSQIFTGSDSSLARAMLDAYHRSD